MKKERVILSFIALFIGLLVAGSAFYLYNQSKTEANETEETTVSVPTPTPGEEGNLLIIDKPKNEDVITSRSVTISGKTLPDTMLVAQSESEEQVGKSSANGSFQFTVDIADGLNVINITALYPDGTQKSETRVITYSNEDF